MPVDAKALAEATATIVKRHVEAATAPLIARIADLEARQLPERGEKGEPGAKGEPGRDGEPGQNGRDADPEQVRSIVGEMVAEAVSALPAPERGPSGERGEKGERGADGCGVRDLLIDRDGNLVATMDDGRIKTLGRVVGHDGQDGTPGAKGEPGRDGFDLRHFDMVPTDERTIEMSFEDESGVRHTYELEIPVPIYRGVYREGEWKRGDMVTWGGSLWHADKDTTGKPDCGDWSLAVKRGRDGKDGKI